MKMEENFITPMNFGCKFKVMKPFKRFKYHRCYKTVGFGNSYEGKWVLYMESIPEKSNGYEYEKFEVYKTTAHKLYEEGYFLLF